MFLGRALLQSSKKERRCGLEPMSLTTNIGLFGFLQSRLPPVRGVSCSFNCFPCDRHSDLVRCSKHPLAWTVGVWLFVWTPTYSAFLSSSVKEHKDQKLISNPPSPAPPGTYFQLFMRDPACFLERRWWELSALLLPNGHLIAGRDTDEVRRPGPYRKPVLLFTSHF